jgi:hypothetical protein
VPLYPPASFVEAGGCNAAVVFTLVLIVVINYALLVM